MKVSRAMVKSKPPIDRLNVVLIDEAILDEAVDWVCGCDACDDHALIPFDYLLDLITECDPTITEYLMCRVETCPFCLGELTEKTRVTLRRR